MKLLLIRTAILAGVLIFWQLASDTLVRALYISSPTKIFAEFWHWVSDGSVFYHAGITATEAFLGFLLGSSIGMIMGLLLGRAERLSEILNPFIVAFYSLPKVALAPLFVIWLGIGISMKVVLTAAIVFFLVFLNTYTGVRSVSRELVTILKLMGASEQQVMRKVILPSAIVWVFAGLRLSVPYAIIGAVVGEMIASNRGLGYLLTRSASEFNTAGVFAALIGIVILSAILNIAVSILARQVMPWEKSEKNREVAI